METPRSTTEMRSFMGMVNQLGKFTPRIAEISQPLRELLSSKRSWVWGPTQDEAFKEIKAELARPTTLALYKPDAPTKICADASAYGLGAVLLQQQHEDEWKPVAFASRSMTETERRYSQIKKEALALCGHARSSLATSSESQSYWRQTTSLWYPSLGRPTSIVCHHKSYASGFVSCDLTIQLPYGEKFSRDKIFADGSSNDNLRIKFLRMPATEESRDRTRQPSEVHWKYTLDDDGSKRTDLRSFTPK